MRRRKCRTSAVSVRGVAAVVVQLGQRRQRGDDVTVYRTSDEHGVFGAGGETVAPGVRDQQGRSRRLAVFVHVVGDVVAGELAAGRRVDGQLLLQVKRQRRGIGANGHD